MHEKIDENLIVPVKPWLKGNKWIDKKKAGLRIRIHFVRIRIQHLRMNTNPDPDLIRIQGFNDQKIEEKKLQLKIFFYFFFKSKTAIYLSLDLHKVCPSYRRSLQLSKEAIQHFKTWTFTTFFLHCGSFLPSWIRIQILNPDPQTRLSPDPIRIRIRNPGKKIKSNKKFPTDNELSLQYR